MSRQADLIQLNVVAGVLLDVRQRVLIAERNEPGPFEGLWEFPGGKIEQTESPLNALQRELREELGVESGDIEPLLSLSHEYPDRHVNIDFFLVRTWQPEPEGREGQALRWVEVSRLHEQALLPADAPLTAYLQANYS